MELLLAPETRPFAIAALILFGLVAIEFLGLVIGVSASAIIDKGFDGHLDTHVEAHGGAHDSWFAGILGWLNPGRVPLLILLMLLLGGFAAVGYLSEALAFALRMPLPVLFACAIAALGGLLITRGGSRLVARIIPRDESYAVEEAELVGLVASVTIGPLDEGRPGRVRVQDRHGNWHFLAARAAEGHGPFATGATVLLADRRDKVFLAIAAGEELTAGR